MLRNQHCHSDKTQGFADISANRGSRAPPLRTRARLLRARPALPSEAGQQFGSRSKNAFQFSSCRSSIWHCSEHRHDRATSETAALIPVLKNPTYHLKRVGLGSWTAITMAVQSIQRHEEAFMSADLDPREARLNEPHVRPLMKLVDKLRKRFADIAEANGDPEPLGVRGCPAFC